MMKKILSLIGIVFLLLIGYLFLFEQTLYMYTSIEKAEKVVTKYGGKNCTLLKKDAVTMSAIPDFEKSYDLVSCDMTIFESYRMAYLSPEDAKSLNIFSNTFWNKKPNLPL